MTRRKLLRLVVAAFGLVAVGVVVMLVVIYVQYVRNDRPITLPVPRGPHAVGRMLRHWKDPKRNRELMVFIWYPAHNGAAGRRSEYIPGRWGELEAQKMLPIPAKRFQEIQVNAIEEAPLSPGSMPVLIMLPGMGRNPAHYTTLAEDLASFGYVVAGVTPTGSSTAVVFPDGHEVDGREFDPLVDGFAKTQEYIDTWAGDASFALDQLTDDSFFKDHLRLNQVGVFGHSFGGSVAVHVLQRDRRFSRAAVLDSAFFGKPIKGLNQPILILTGGDAIDPEWRALCDSNRAGCTTHEFPSARHMNFSDAGILPSRFPLPKFVLMLGDVDGAAFLRDVSDRLQGFFSKK
jgi:pimeloyl-ACP methyl ester carboxylesterase